ncbi:MAG: ferredoxin, partial [Sulfurovum sp.]
IADTLIAGFGKSVETFTHKAGLEEAVLYLILDLFADKEKLPTEVKAYIDSFKTTETQTITEKVEKTIKEMVLNEETGEEEEVSKKVKEDVQKEIIVTTNGLVDLLGGDSSKFDDVFAKMMSKKEAFSLMVGEDFYFHPKAENLAKLVALIEATCNMDVVMTPPKSNALGVALICDLDDTATGYTVGYNENGDFRLSALGDGDLDMPAMNQQEGTLTSMSKRVLPTNAALEYEGYELNDIVKALVGAPEHTIDWTQMLPVSKGFKALAFDTLPNAFTNDGRDNRGYVLDVTRQEVQLPAVEPFDQSVVLEGEIAYRCNPARQFNDFTDKSHEIFETFSLYASPAKAESLGEKVEVVFENGSIVLDVVSDAKMEGDIVKVPDFKAAKDVYGLFGASRYQTVTIRKV